MTDEARSRLPGLHVLRTYKRAWLGNDIAAGLVLTAVLVPVGMGYAQAAGLPAIAGLYATILPLLVYAVVGPSPVLVLGPDSSLAPIIAATIAPLMLGDPARAGDLAAGLALVSGTLCIAFGVLRLGILTELLSKPIRIGTLNGLALTIFVGQLPKLFGFEVEGSGVPAEAIAFGRGLTAGLTNTTALALGVGSFALILACRVWRPQIPGILIAALGATALTAALGLAASAGVPVVGPLPPGLPSFHVPRVSLEEVQAMLAGGVAIAVISMADTSVLSRTFAGRSGKRIDQDQELLALGSASIGAGFFGGFSVSASASRTPVAVNAGAKTQLASVVGALTIAALLLVAPWITTNLPESALAAIVMSASLSLVDVPGTTRLWRLRRSEFVLSVVCVVGVAVAGVVTGIFIAVALSLLLFFWRAWRPHSAILGRVEGIKGYHDVSRYPGARQPEGLVIFRWDAPLFFANAEVFRDQIEAAIAAAAAPTRWVIVAAEPMTDIDVTAEDMLAELVRALEAKGISLRFAELKDPVKDHLKSYGLFERMGADAFFPTLGTAVDAYVAATGTPWVDWEDRASDGPPEG